MAGEANRGHVAPGPRASSNTKMGPTGQGLRTRFPKERLGQGSPEARPEALVSRIQSPSEAPLGLGSITWSPGLDGHERLVPFLCLGEQLPPTRSPASPPPLCPLSIGGRGDRLPHRLQVTTGSEASAGQGTQSQALLPVLTVILRKTQHIKSTYSLSLKSLWQSAIDSLIFKAEV